MSLLIMLITTYKSHFYIINLRLANFKHMIYERVEISLCMSMQSN